MSARSWEKFIDGGPTGIELILEDGLFRLIWLKICSFEANNGGESISNETQLSSM